MSSDASFYGDGSKAITAKTDAHVNPRRVFDVDEYYELARCSEWLRSTTDVSRVALQFPDELLIDSVSVITKLEQQLPAFSFYILADTSYGSCCVDLVAAQHYSADALIHFGTSCLSPASGIPILWVFGRAPVDVADCCHQITELVSRGESDKRNYVLMFDVQYNYIADEIFIKLRESIPDLILSHVRSCANIDSASPTESSHCEINGRKWCSTPGANSADSDVIFIGNEGRTLTTLMFVMNSSKFLSYCPQTRVCRQETVNVNRALMKRMYFIERAKDANIIGIVVGTLAVSNYLSIHNRLKELIKKAGRKSYTVVVGKLNTSKLANFMEVDIFVLVGCSENTLVDSTEFYKPIITPYELELALNTERQWNGDYITDFRSLLPEGSKYQALPEIVEVETDVSLVTGAMRTIGITDNTPDDSKQVAVRNTTTDLATLSSAKSASEFLVSRTWTGLKPDLGNTTVEKAKQGRTGIAMGYGGEPT